MLAADAELDAGPRRLAFFSGHGVQQSPAIGRGLSEIIVHGHYRTLDLTPLSYARVIAGEPFLEEAVV